MSIKPIVCLAVGLAIAAAGFFAIGFACRYGLVATIMTGQIMLPGLPLWLPYRRILSLAVCLILYAIYLWTRGRTGSDAANKSLAVAIIGVGVAAIGFLSVSYPCPYNIGLSMLLQLETHVGEFGVPYWVFLAVAACLLVYAALVRASSTPRPERST